MSASWTIGERVFARGEEWRIAQVSRGTACLALTLSGVGRENGGRSLVLLTPFDRLRRITPIARPRATRLRGWLRALRALIATTGPFATLRAAAAARIDLLPHQLAPALAAVNGLACRFLLADAVGLGKTIQAGLMLAELRARGEAARCLILTPVGLRDQWAAELAGRFDLPSTIVDRAFARAQQLRYAQAVNPWRLDDISIASFDYAKRPDVRPALAQLWWDLLIVDEAHAAAPETDRGRLVDFVAARSRRVVLLTATPHAGDAAAFASLCRTGAGGDGPMLMFRRSRREAGLVSRRRVALLGVAPTPAERHVYDELTRYTALVARQVRAPDAWLALVVLNKRALSSTGSLARSVARRLSLLAENAPAEDRTHQLPLDFTAGLDDTDDGDEEPSVIGAPALADAAQERAILRGLHEAALEAARAESKIAALARLLRRVREPAIVFTEYRDTLCHLAEQLQPREAALLHGGLSRRERQQAAQAFTSGQVDLLLATDAAGEGLNLQARCRLVVNLELPWSPRRLEQRVGRVDRIGQRRTVHAVHLFARGTGESRVLARLVRRTERIRAALEDPDAIALPAEPALLHAMAGTGPDVIPWAEPRTDSALVAADVRTVDVSAEAQTEAGRLQEVRRIRSGAVAAAAIADADCARLRAALDRRAPWITRAPRHRFRALSPPGVLCIYRLVLASGSAGRTAEETLVPIWLACDGDHRLVRDEIARVLEALAQQRLDAILASHARVVSALRAREEALVARAQAQARRAEQLTQQGLFDRRAVRLAERRARARQQEGDRTACRLAAAADASLRAVIPPEPALVLIHPGAHR